MIVVLARCIAAAISSVGSIKMLNLTESLMTGFWSDMSDEKY
jgi:hypothetical protein